jgi:DNA (cytosine-5)-methyltransferase 1
MPKSAAGFYGEIMTKGKPRLLDLFCGAGGCTAGYQRAGFWVRGVDIKPQPRYCGDEFVQADALEYLQGLIDSGEVEEFDAIHASPPCQGYAATKVLNPTEHPLLLEDTRRLCNESGRFYVLENVPGAPLLNPARLNGQLFGLMVDRERWFECGGFEVPFVLLPSPRKAVKMGRQVREGDVIQVVGNFSGVDYARRAMGVDWMVRNELSQAIPPAYTEFIGKQLIEAITR